MSPREATAASIQALAEITASVDTGKLEPTIERKAKSTVNPEARAFITGPAWAPFVEAAGKNAAQWVRVPIAYPSEIVKALIGPLRMALNGTRAERGEDARHHWLVRERPVAPADAGYAKGIEQSAIVIKCHVWTWQQVEAQKVRGEEAAKRARDALARKQRAAKRAASKRGA